MSDRGRSRSGIALAALLLSGIPTWGAHAQGTNATVKTIEGSESGVRAEILSLRRTEGGLLTLRIVYENSSGGEVKNKALPGNGNVENFQLVDFPNKRKYSVLRTSDGACLLHVTEPVQFLRARQAYPVGQIHRTSSVGDADFTSDA
jgi:hypothetical protein